jgi:hypothetical protein
MPNKWYRDQGFWLELFILVNLGFLALDIYLAHSVNEFRHPAEYIPLVFSLLSPPVLFFSMLARWLRGKTGGLWRRLEMLVGTASILIGVAGLVWHLESRFFTELTLESLVYTAPFAAPLAYTGLGLLVVMNRMVDTKSLEWAMWVLFMALGGYVGNFIFSLADHAQNAFYHQTEWIPVASCAYAVGFLLAPFLVQVNRTFIAISAVVMFLQIFVGLAGAYLHTVANLHGPATSQLENFIHGAPAMAPLLLPNLTLLAWIGLWRMWELAGAEEPTSATPYTPSHPPDPSPTAQP